MRKFQEFSQNTKILENRLKNRQTMAPPFPPYSFTRWPLLFITQKRKKKEISLPVNCGLLSLHFWFLKLWIVVSLWNSNDLMHLDISPCWKKGEGGDRLFQSFAGKNITMCYFDICLSDHVVSSQGTCMLDYMAWDI